MIHKLKGHTDGVSSIAFTPSGDLLASGANDLFMLGSKDSTIILWDLKNGV